MIEIKLQNSRRLVIDDKRVALFAPMVNGGERCAWSVPKHLDDHVGLVHELAERLSRAEQSEGTAVIDELKTKGLY